VPLFLSGCVHCTLVHLHEGAQEVSFIDAICWGWTPYGVSVVCAVSCLVRATRVALAAPSVADPRPQCMHVDRDGCVPLGEGVKPPRD